MPLDRLTDLLGNEEEIADGTVVLYECRHCGTKFEKHRKQCPECDAKEIATYEFENDGEMDECNEEEGGNE